MTLKYASHTRLSFLKITFFPQLLNPFFSKGVKSLANSTKKTKIDTNPVKKLIEYSPLQNNPKNLLETLDIRNIRNIQIDHRLQNKRD